MLPEKWCVLVTANNQEKLSDWYRENIQYYDRCKPEWKVGVGAYFHFPQNSSGCHTTFKSTLGETYKEISFEEFKMHILKEQIILNYEIW